MYQASKKFGDAIAGSNRKFNTRLLENEKVLVESVKNFTITSGAEEITIGSAVASYVQATIENKGIALSGKEVSLEIGVEVDGDMEYIPMGLYTIQNPKIESNKVTFTAYDRLASRCNGAYYSKLGYPVDAVDILAEISTMTGVAIDTSTLQRGIQINQRAIIEEGDYNEETEESEVITTYVNPFDGYTYKETIGFIAGLFGKFAICGRTGMIEFRWYQGIDYEIPSNIFYNDLQETEESFSIKRLTCDNSDQTLSSGSGATGISMQNPVMTQSILDGVYNTVQGLVFTPAALRFIGDTRLDIGDIVTAVKNDCTKFTIPIISLITSYDGGLMQTIASYGNTAEEDDSDTKGPITEMAERVEYELAFVKKLMVDNLTATNATIKNLSGDVLKFKTGEFETLKTDVANFKQTFTDDLQASNAKINTLESDHATFKEATAINLNATNARIANIEADYLKATDAKLTYATITNLNTTNAEIIKLKTKDAEIDKLVATKAAITDLNAAVGRVGVLESSYANLNTLVNGNLTSDNIQNLILTSKNTTIENGMIKNAMIENLSFDKITGMDINTTNLTVHSSDGKSKWSDNTIQISDANRVRVQIGKDASNDYSMSVWDKNGNLIWDALGATEKTIQRKIIRDGIVADDANISGSKLDINSVINEVNGSTTKLKSSTIVMNDKNQTLDIVFNEMETTVADNLSSAKLYADGKLSDAQKYALEQANSALSSAKSYADSAVDNIEVGGRNLLTGVSSYTKDTPFEKTDSRADGWIVYQNIITSIELEAGKKYVLQAKTDGNWIANHNTNGQDPSKKLVTLWLCSDTTNDFFDMRQGYVVFTPAVTAKYKLRVNQYSNGTDAYTIHLWDIKLEKGSKATDWTPAPEDTQSQIDNITEITTSHTTSISTMQGQILSLISEDTMIKGNYDALLSRYNATVNTVDSMKTTIGEHTTILNSQNDSIAAVTTKANTIESNLAGTTQTVSEVKSNLAGTQERVTKVETSLTGLTTRVSSTETNLANLEIGGRNLVLGSKADIWKNGKEIDSDGYTEGYTEGIGSWNEYYPKLSFISDDNNKISGHITISAYVKCPQNMIGNACFGFNISNSNGRVADWNINLTYFTNHEKINDNTWTYIMYTTEGFSSDFNCNGIIHLQIKTNPSFTKGSKFWYKKIKVEKGNKATDWTPAPEDADQQITAAETIASQTADKFNWLVKSGTNSTDFELTDRTATLVASAINMHGLVTFNGLNTDAKNEIGKVAQSKVDNLDIGGRNLLRNSGKFLLSGTTTGADYSTGTWRFAGSSTMTKSHVEISDPPKSCQGVTGAFQAVGSHPTTSPDGECIGMDGFPYFDEEIGSDVVFSGWARVVGGGDNCYFGFSSYMITFSDGKLLNDYNCIKLNTDGSWTRIVIHGKTTKKVDNIYCGFLTGTESVTVQACGLKLEKGNKATDWTPAPEDYLPQANLVSNWTTNSTWIDGGKIYTGSITADKIATDAIRSKNYVANSTGSFLNLADGTFDSKYLKWDASGNISATSGTIGCLSVNNGSLVSKGIDINGYTSIMSIEKGCMNFVDSDTTWGNKLYLSTRGLHIYESATNSHTSYDSDGIFVQHDDKDSIVCGYYIYSSGEIQTSNCQMRITNGNTGIGCMLRNDNESFYILRTESGQPYGDWTSARPMRIQWSTSNVWFENNLYAGNDLVAGSWIYAGSGGHYTWNGRTDAYLGCGNYNNTNNIYYYAGYHAFYVNGDSGSGMMYIETSGVSSRKGFRNSSDERIKKDFQHFDDDFIKSYMQLEPIKYRFKDDTDNSYHIGFKAQNVNGVLNDYGKFHNEQFGICATHHIDPEYAEKTYGEKNMTEVYTLAYDELIGANTFMIQKTRKDLMYQAGRIDMQEAIINDLQTRLLQAEKTIKQLTQALA